MKRILLFLFAALMLTACNKVLTGLYGIKSIKPVNDKVILKYCKRYGIPEQSCYKLDTSYFTWLFSLDTSRLRSQVKNHYQPLQALYYDETGTLQSFQVNCYAGGFPNLEWERDSNFTTFIPQEQAPADSILPLARHLEFLAPLPGSNDLSVGDADYVVIGHWSKFMGRQSKRLIRLVQENAQGAENKKVKIIYVNNDNLFAGAR